MRRSTAGRYPFTLRAAAALAALLSCGASYRTTNFIVTAGSERQAREIAEQAERMRRQVALDWLDRELPRWPLPCPVLVQVDERRTARGETSYLFRGGQAVDWKMRLEGPWRTLVDSVLPHEIAHTVFATHFGRPVPRWAEEGVCVFVEHPRDRRSLEASFVRHLADGRVVALDQMFARERGFADLSALYSQGYSLVSYFVVRGGKQRFIHFLDEGMISRDWHAAAFNHYGYQDLQQLQDAWLSWALPEHLSLRQVAFRIEPGEPIAAD